MQSLRHSPEGFFPVRRFDQSDADRIEAEAVEPMSAKAAMVALPIGRHDEEEGAARRQVAQHRHDETEGGRKRVCHFRYDLMQGAAAEATLRQMGIDSGQAEGQGAVDIAYPRQKTAQLPENGGARGRRRYGAVWRHCEFKRRGSRVGH